MSNSEFPTVVSQPLTKWMNSVTDVLKDKADLLAHFSNQLIIPRGLGIPVEVLWICIILPCCNAPKQEAAGFMPSKYVGILKFLFI